MLFLLIISSISLAFFFSKSSSLQPLPQWVNELRLLSILLCQELLSFLVQWLKSSSLIIAATLLKIPPKMSTTEEAVPRIENVEETSEISVLDLPELVLECILGRLSPDGLCNMGLVCSSLTERCRSDHLWQRHMNEKWGRVIGQAALKEWQLYIASSKESFNGGTREGKAKGWIWSVSCLWALSWLQSKTYSGSSSEAKIDSASKLRTSLPVDSLMSWYLSLESGKFWFPAQVYNRENGHVGFMLSCYDAELSYDYGTDTFHARYPPHGRRTTVIEESVQWNRIRVSPVDTCPLDLHLSDCLNDLRPGNHIEIQWRRNKEFPYGWWYGVVGHLESCDQNDLHCQCHSSDTVVLEFNQYAPGSRWRRAFINRKDHREEGNEGDGFYGGIRKIYDEEEISTWKKLWPAEKLE